MEYLLIAILTYTLFFIRNNYFAKSYAGVDETKVENYNKVSYLAVIILILFAGLRAFSVGYDVPNYYKNFELILESKDLSDGHSFELLYNIINLMCAYIFGESGFTFVLIICAAIILVCVTFTAKNLSPDISLTMFLFVTVDVYFRGFDQLRQSVAIAILMCAVVFVVKRKPIMFIFFVLLATLFHNTSLIFLPVYLFNYINKKNVIQYSFYGVVILVAAVFCIFEKQIIKIVCDIFGLSYYDQYVAAGFGIEKLTTIGWFEIVFNVLIVGFFLIYKIWYEKKNKKQISSNYNLFLGLYFCSTILYLVSAICGRPSLYGRLVYYFFWSLIILVPIFISTIENKKWKMAMQCVMMLVGFLYLILSIFLIDAHGIVPYVSVI